MSRRRIYVTVVLAAALLLSGVGQAFAATGDFLGVWGGLGIGNGDFNGPRSVAVAPNGDVYVVDFLNRRIQYFSPTGVYKGQWGWLGTGNGQFTNPIGVAVAPNGDVYVVESFPERVQYFSPTGTFKGKWGSPGTGNGQFATPWGIAVAPNGDVYVVDQGNYRIQYFSPTGEFKGKWGSKGNGDGQFIGISSVAVAPNGDVYVGQNTEERVQYFSPTGAFKGKWGSYGAGNGQFNTLHGVGIAPNGDVFVADTWNYRIQYFSPTGAFKGTWGSKGAGNGQFDPPISVAIGSSGNVYVADNYNNRVQYFAGPAFERAASAMRVAGADRYSTAVELAKAAYPGYRGVRYVVVASGEDRAAADPLAAAGLCGVLDAPLLLVHSGGVPGSVAAAIGSMPSGVTVVVVGGRVSVPSAVSAQLAGIKGVKAVQRVEGSDRYATARSIAARMKSELAKQGSVMPRVALLANGADPATFFDALALSAVSAHNRYPILLLRGDAVPPATSAALAEHSLATRIIGGGPRTVSERVRTQLGATRWYGADRYATAAEISRQAHARSWSNYRTVGVAAALPDALTGGASVGVRGGTLLLTRSDSVPPVTAAAIKANRAKIAELTVLGGPRAITEGVRTQLTNLLK